MIFKHYLLTLMLFETYFSMQLFSKKSATGLKHYKSPINVVHMTAEIFLIFRSHTKALRVKLKSLFIDNVNLCGKCGAQRRASTSHVIGVS